MKVLIIAPHPDDELLGVGGTLIKHVHKQDRVYVCVVTRGVEPLFRAEDVQRTRDETIKCHVDLRIEKTFYLDFSAVMLEMEKRFLVNEKILDVIKESLPDIVYIPHIGDMQKDHQIVAEAAMVALRPKYDHQVKRILAYETLSETGWHIPNVSNQFIPNVYSDISEYLPQKLKAMSYYQTQLSNFPNPRSIEAIEALAKYRGSSVNVRAAEAFMLIRDIF
jgi:LmbE family N-acetylglucosaminyl deacetylase